MFEKKFSRARRQIGDWLPILIKNPCEAIIPAIILTIAGGPVLVNEAGAPLISAADVLTDEDGIPLTDGDWLTE